jgi:pSer/pThr/pTyr-binding forkhead associated (FHA) protein
MSPQGLTFHQASPAELQARLRAERDGLPFLLCRESGAQRIMPLAAGRDRVTIGRHRSNDVALESDTEISRLHAALERLGSSWTLVDDGLSHNGSYVNEARVAGRRRLRDGDVLRFGQTTLVYIEPADIQTSSPTQTPRGLAARRDVTPTQRKVLVALCRPLRDSAHATPATNRGIADELFLSVDAVKTHLRTLYERFGIEDLPQNEKRARLAALALEHAVVVQHDLWR